MLLINRMGSSPVPTEVIYTIEVKQESQMLSTKAKIEMDAFIAEYCVQNVHLMDPKNCLIHC